MLAGKAVIVTGSGRGIGKAIAIALAEQGANVVINDIQMDPALETMDEIKKMGRQAIFVKADVTSEEEVNNMVKTCVDTFGKVDIIVNNAGIVQTKPLLEITAKEWDLVMEVNLKGVFLCCKAVFPYMIEQKAGKIINIASVAGKRGGGIMGNSSYSASKGGVIAFTKAIAREGGKYGINVNAITPALTETEMTKGINQDKKETIIKSVPLGRTGRPEDIAKAVCFLASSWSDYMTGEIMDVDGGLMMD